MFFGVTARKRFASFPVDMGKSICEIVWLEMSLPSLSRVDLSKTSARVLRSVPMRLMMCCVCLSSFFINLSDMSSSEDIEIFGDEAAFT